MVARAAPARRAGVTFAMLSDLWKAGLRRALAPLRVALRRSWIYRQFLGGRMPDRIRHQPQDVLPRRLDDADALLKGRFRYAGAMIELKQGSIFDLAAPNPGWAAALHGFEWLSALASAGGEAARTLAVRLVTEWLARNARYGEPAWLPEITARRLVQILAHGRLVLADSDVLWRSRLFVSLRDQTGQLGRTVDEAPPGLSRLEAAVAHVLACACLEDNPKHVQAGLDRLEQELSAQILPDGGHVSRSPEELLLAYRQIVMAIDVLRGASVAVPAELLGAHDRIAPMLRFFRHGDGALAVFNGGGESDPGMLAALLARDEVRGQPFQHAPHSGYQRLASARSLAIMDCGPPPPGPFSCRAHAGCLAFEFSAGGQRIVVNCGAEKDDTARWRGALRATAAHSTVTLADTSMCAILSAGLARQLLGPRLLASSARVDTDRRETAQGRRVEAGHEFYIEKFGIAHRRELILSKNGTKLAGCDRLLPTAARGGRPAIPYAVRFHIHPDLRVSPSQSGDVLLKLPGGEGWRFRHGGPVAIEESIYVGRGSVRRAEQLVLSGEIRNEAVEIAWAFEQIGAE